MSMQKNDNELSYLKNILSSIPNSVYWVNKDNVFLGCNAEHARVFGLRHEEEVIGKNCYDLMPKKYADAAIAANNEVMASGRSKIFEELAVLPDKKEAIFLSHKSPLYNQQKEIVGVIGNSINISPRDASSNELGNHYFSYLLPKIFDGLDNYNTLGEYILAIKDYYESMLAQMPGHIYWEDRNGLILGCNDAQATDAGLSERKDAIGKTIFDFLPKKQATLHKKNNQAVLTTGKKQIFEEVSNTADGQEAIYLSQKVAIRDKQDRIVGVLGISIDITDRKRAEEYQRKHEAEAAETAQKIINFTNLMAGSMAHELRTPLQGVSVHIDLIEGILTSKQSQQDKDNFLREVVKQIKKVIKSSNETITDMLIKIRAFASGHLPKQSFEERSIIADVEEFLDNYPFESEQKDLISTSYTARFKYRGDKNLTHHLLSNFTKNALHAIRETDKTDAKITIETKIDPNDGFNLLIFRDTATGIPAEFLPKIFDQFATKKDTKGGTGLGLAFCKMIMQDYGGDVICNSKEGEFTEFVLKFPKI